MMQHAAIVDEMDDFVVGGSGSRNIAAPRIIALRRRSLSRLPTIFSPPYSKLNNAQQKRSFPG